MYNLNNGIDESTIGGGIIRYHRAEWDPDGKRNPDCEWLVWFTDDPTRFRGFTAAEGEAMGLTPPAPLVVTCNGHSVDVPEWELADFIAEWGEDGIEDYSAGSSRLATRFAYWLRDASQDPQPASDPEPAPADSDTLDFDAMPIGTVLWDDSDSDFLLRFPGGWSYNPPADENDYYDIDAYDGPFTVVYQPAPVSPYEGLRAVLAGRDDPDEPHPDADFIEVDYWCHFDDKGRAVRVHDTSTVHMDGCARMYVRAADR